MFIRLPILLCLLALATAGCMSPRRQATAVLKTVGPAALRNEAAILYKDLFASKAPDVVSVKNTEWRASFRAFEPKKVGAYSDGFALALQIDGDIESGLYVIPAQMDVKPRPKPGTRFEQITDGIYWYTFTRKKRSSPL